MSKLGSLFGGGGGSDSNDQLKYSAPKEPKKAAPAKAAPVATTPIIDTTKNYAAAAPSKPLGPSKIMASATVRLFKVNPSTHAYDSVDGGNQLGCVIMGTGTTFQILIYNGQKAAQATIMLTATTDYTVRDLYMSLTDTQGTSWSILFDSVEVMHNCLRTIVAVIVHQATHSENPIAWETLQRSLPANPENASGEDQQQQLAVGMAAGIYLSVWEMGEVSDYPGDVVAGRPLRQVVAPEEVIKIKLAAGVEEVVAGLTTALVGLKKGDRFMLGVSPKQAYRLTEGGFVNVAARAHPGSWLLVEAEVVKIKSSEGKDKKKEKAAAQAAAAASSAAAAPSTPTPARTEVPNDIDYGDNSGGGNSDLKDRMKRLSHGAGGMNLMAAAASERVNNHHNQSPAQSNRKQHNEADYNNNNSNSNNNNSNNNNSSNGYGNGRDNGRDYDSRNNQNANRDNYRDNNNNNNRDNNRDSNRDDYRDNGNNNYGRNNDNSNYGRGGRDGGYNDNRGGGSGYGNNNNSNNNYRDNNRDSRDNRYNDRDGNSNNNNRGGGGYHEYALTLVDGQEARSYYQDDDNNNQGGGSNSLHNRGASERNNRSTAESSSLQSSMMVIQQSIMQLHTKLDSVGTQVTTSLTLQQQQQQQVGHAAALAGPYGMPPVPAAAAQMGYMGAPSPYAPSPYGAYPPAPQQQQYPHHLHHQLAAPSPVKLKGDELISSLQYLISEYENSSKNAANSSKNNEHLETINNLKATIAKLEEKNETLLTRNEKLMTEKSALLEKQADMIQSGSNSSNKLYSLQQEVEQLRREKQNQQSELDSLRSRGNTASESDRAEKMELTNRVTSLQNEVVDLKMRAGDLDSVRYQLNDKEARLKKANDEIDSLQARLEQALNNAAAAAAVASAAPSAVDLNSSEVQEYVSERVSAVQRQLDVVNGDLSAARAALSSEQDAVKSLRDEVGEWKEKFTALQSEWLSSGSADKERADALQAKVTELLATIDELKQSGGGGSGKASSDELKSIMQDIYTKASEYFEGDDEDASYSAKDVLKRIRMALKQVTSARAE